MRLADVLGFVGFAASSALIHGLLRAHYLEVCRPSWLGGLVGLADASEYCQLVRRGLSGLQLSTALAGLGIAPGLLLRHHHGAA